MTKIIKENIDSPEIRDLVAMSFNTFLKKNLFKYPDYHACQIGFVGSIAFHFKDILESVLKEAGLKPAKIIEQPIEGLILYHNKY